MVLQRGVTPPPSRPWEDAPNVDYRLYKNRIKMARSYDSTIVVMKRLILRESGNESEGTQFVTEKKSNGTDDGNPCIHKVPHLPISKDKYFTVSMYPPDDLDEDDPPMDGEKPVKFLFSFYTLYLNGYLDEDDIWHLFSDAMIEGISQEARDSFIKMLRFPGNYGTIGQNYQRLIIGFNGQCDTYNKVVRVSSGKTSDGELVEALCRTIISLPEATRFLFLAQFHIRSFHSGNFDTALDRLVIEGEEYRNFSSHLNKWGTYSAMSKKGKKRFDSTAIASSGITSFRGLLNFIAVATSKRYDEEQSLLKHEGEKKHSIGDGDGDKKGGNPGENNKTEDSQDQKKANQDNGKTWFYEAPLMPYVPHERQNRNLDGEQDVDTCAMLEIGRKTCLKDLSWTLLLQVDKLGKDSLINSAEISSKLIPSDNAFIANMAVKPFQAVNTTNFQGEVKYPIKSIKTILKALVRSAEESCVVNVYILNTCHAAQGMPTRISLARIACLDFNPQKIRRRECNITIEQIEKVLKAGANVVFTTLGIDDMSLKHIVEAGPIAVRRLHKEDSHHAGKASGSTRVIGVGGGAAEAALSVRLENQAMTLGCRERLAIGELAESLSITPKVPDELMPEGPWESPGMGKARRLVDCTPYPLCGPSILNASARSWYADRPPEDWEHHDHYPLGRAVA